MADLTSLRAELAASLEAMQAEGAAVVDDRKPVELDQQAIGRLSRMDSLQNQAMAQASEQRRMLTARRIRAAITRIDDGEFGMCVKCGEDIAEGRLKADPMATVCISCASG